MVALLREYRNTQTFPGEFKLLEGQTRQILIRLAQGSVDGDALGLLERELLGYARRSSDLARLRAQGLRRLQGKLPENSKFSKMLAPHLRTASFPVKRVFPDYPDAVRSLVADLRAAHRENRLSPGSASLALESFLLRLFAISPSSPQIPVLDQFLKPGNLPLAPLFPSGRFILVTRDPRDQFCDILSRKTPKPKYLRPERAATFAWDYARRYRHEDELLANAPDNVLAVAFEDLVYRYTETKSRVEAFLGLDPAMWQGPRFFLPDQARANTRLYPAHPRQEEIDLIESQVAFRLYPFDEVCP